MNLSKLVIPALFGLSTIITGCSTSQTVNTTTNSPQSKATEQNPQNTSHADGDLISLTSITVPHTNSDMKTYKMMYWSHNTKTEAFLAVPKEAGMYPLFVNLHGGADTAYPVSHYTSPASSTTLEYAQNGFITLVPEYRGYADSDGTIPNLQGEVLDVDNTMEAIKSTAYSVEPNHIYLEGASMGGAVALQLSAERDDIKSVIAISPFVGWNIVGPWATENKGTNPIAQKYYTVMERNYGPYSRNNSKFKPVSVDYQKIHVPTLLLQVFFASKKCRETLRICA
ncbi:hypothetical protein AAC03nite_39640 [Alicyclobacillus acidoterrestris]|nr:hypothetical protein AAC03nite_39640 [Alicyclobacillus acidoterrestris]